MHLACIQSQHRVSQSVDWTTDRREAGSEATGLTFVFDPKFMSLDTRNWIWYTSSIGMQILMISVFLKLAPHHTATQKMSPVCLQSSLDLFSVHFVSCLRWVTMVSAWLVTWLIQLANLIGIPTFQNTAPKNLNLQPDVSPHSAWGAL